MWVPLPLSYLFLFLFICKPSPHGIYISLPLICGVTFFSAWRPYWFSGVIDRDVSSEVDIFSVCSVLHIGNDD